MQLTVEIADIKDRDSLEAWLFTQPQQVSVGISHRAAMRLLPLWWGFTQASPIAKKGDLTALPVLRCNLISGVARTMPTPDIKAAAAAAAAAAATAAATTADVVNVWALIHADCAAILGGVDLDRLALWGREGNPLKKTWEKIKSQLSVDWSFWIKWYDDALAGHPPNWKMLEQIALIDSEDWDKGEVVVNKIIGEIQLRYDLKEQIAKLEDDLRFASAKTVAGIGDNLGPPLDDVPMALEALIIWEPLQGLKQELEAKTPDKSRVIEWAKKLGLIGVAIVKYLGRKADKFVDGAMGAAGKAAGVAAVGAFVAWYSGVGATEVPVILEKITQIAQTAKAWAGNLP